MAETGSTNDRESGRLDRFLFGKPVTPGRAWQLIATISLLLTIIGGVAAWIFDRAGFGSLGDSLWWALQTVTTIGYGDVVPENGFGRIVGAVLMLNGIALLSVLTAIITALLIERGRRRLARNDDTPATLARIEARLAAIEERLESDR